MSTWRVRPRERAPFGRVEVPGLEVPELVLGAPNFTEYGRWLINSQVPLGLVNASIGNAVENKVLDHLVANTTYTAPSPSLGLWTSTVDDTSTAATAGELSYT